MLTNPQNSLPQAYKILTEFSELSYYKVNHSKSLILNLNIPKTTITKIKKGLTVNMGRVNHIIPRHNSYIILHIP